MTRRWVLVQRIVAVLLLLPLLSALAPVEAAEIYHNYSTLQSDTQALADAHPEIARYFIVGQSELGLDMFGVEVANNLSNLSDDELRTMPTMYVDGGHHGNEILGIEAAYYFLEGILERASADPTYLEGKRLIVTPVINPDGFLIDKRPNTNGVDLNRNYPFHWGLYGTSGIPNPVTGTYRGSSPASEAETQANIALMQDANLFVYLSGHTGSYDIVLPWNEAEDGDIPDWGLYETFLAEAENVSGLGYRSPSGAGESIAYGYGNRTALSLIVEVSTAQNFLGTPGTAKQEVSEPLEMYFMAWENLEKVGGQVEIEVQGEDWVEVINSGWSPAYNISAGKEIIPVLNPGQAIRLPKSGTMLHYERMIINGDSDDLGSVAIDLTLYPVVASENEESSGFTTALLIGSAAILTLVAAGVLAFLFLRRSSVPKQED